MAVLALTGAAGCGGDDGDGNGQQQTAPASRTFVVDGVPFRFSYPSNFAPVPAEQLPTGFIAILGTDQLNFIDVRLTANEELSQKKVASRVRRTLERSGVTITGEEQITSKTGIPLVRFTTDSNSGGTALKTQLHFFNAGGRTWELACQSSAAGAVQIAQACENALASLALA